MPRFELAAMLALLIAAVALIVVGLIANSPLPGAPVVPSSPAVQATREGVTLRDDFDGQGDLQWKFFNGDWESGDGVLRGPRPRSKAIAHVGTADFVCTVTLRTTSSTGQGMVDVTRVLFRVQDLDNYCALVPRHDGAIELIKVQEGQRRPPFPLAYVWTNTSPYDQVTYQVRADGPRIEVTLNGKPILRYTDPRQLLGHGIGVSNDRSKGEITRVQVTKLIAQPGEGDAKHP